MCSLVGPVCWRQTQLPSIFRGCQQVVLYLIDLCLQVSKNIMGCYYQSAWIRWCKKLSKLGLGYTLITKLLSLFMCFLCPSPKIMLSGMWLSRDPNRKRLFQERLHPDCSWRISVPRKQRSQLVTCMRLLCKNTECIRQWFCWLVFLLWSVVLICMCGYTLWFVSIMFCHMKVWPISADCLALHAHLGTFIMTHFLRDMKSVSLS